MVRFIAAVIFALSLAACVRHVRPSLSGGMPGLSLDVDDAPPVTSDGGQPCTFYAAPWPAQPPADPDEGWCTAADGGRR